MQDYENDKGFYGQVGSATLGWATEPRWDSIRLRAWVLQMLNAIALFIRVHPRPSAFIRGFIPLIGAADRLQDCWRRPLTTKTTAIDESGGRFADLSQAHSIVYGIDHWIPITDAEYLAMFRIMALAMLTLSLNAIDGVVTTSSVALTTGETLASATSKGALTLRVGETTLVAGYRQVTSIRQDPIIMRFDGLGDDAVKIWQRSDMDTTGVDSQGVGLLWDGADRLYVLITVDGGSNEAGTVRRFTAAGWLSDYGAGGGAKATVIMRVDPSSGEPQTGSYIRARLSNGNTNTALPAAVAFYGDAVVVHLTSFFSPLRVNRQRMNHDSGTSPFAWRLVLEPSLAQARRSEAPHFDGVETLPPLPQRQVRWSISGLDSTPRARVIINDTEIARVEGSPFDSGIYDPAALCRLVLLPPIPSSPQ